MPYLSEFITAFGVVLLESAPLVVLGFLIAGLLHEFVPARLLKKKAGGRGLTPVTRAVGVGAILPICSCSTIPLGIGMTRSGASIGTALAFMTSSPAISPVTLVLGWGLLGPLLLGWYSAVTLLGAVLLGLVGNWRLGEVAKEPAPSTGCGCRGCSKPSTGSRFLKAIRWAFADLGVEISSSLVLGLCVASLIMVALPAGFVADWLDRPSWIALVVAVGISLPAYTCSVPSLVIAGSLLARGVDPGVAVAFLIAGPATNLGELNAIRSGMGHKAAAFYASSLILIAFAAGAATAWLPEIAPAGQHAHAGHEHSHALDVLLLGDNSQASLAAAPLWRWPFAVGVIGLAIWSLVRQVKLRPNREPEEAAVVHAHSFHGVATK